MSSNEDTEKRAGFVSTSEPGNTGTRIGSVCHLTLHPKYNLTRMVATGDDDDHSSLRSPTLSRSRSRSQSRNRGRNRSLNRGDRSRSQSQNRNRSRNRSLNRGERSRSRAPSDSQLRQSSDSTRSRRSSREAPIQRRVTFNGETPTPQDDRPQGSPKRNVHLNPNNPGDWVIRHHRSSLVVQLDDHEVGKIRSTLGGMREKLQGFRLGDEEAHKETKPAVSGDGKRFRVSFAEVQRMRIRKLQCQLVRHVVKMRLDGHESPGWEETLEQYSMLLRSSPCSS